MQVILEPDQPTPIRSRQTNFKSSFQKFIHSSPQSFMKFSSRPQRTIFKSPSWETRKSVPTMKLIPLLKLHGQERQFERPQTAAKSRISSAMNSYRNTFTRTSTVRYMNSTLKPRPSTASETKSSPFRNSLKLNDIRVSSFMNNAKIVHKHFEKH
jgi:hypothetical protein